LRILNIEKKLKILLGYGIKKKENGKRYKLHFIPEI